MGPWALVLAYDFVLYIWRSTTYKIPVVGGEARGRQRPRAPSLTKRPSGHRRQISLVGTDAAVFEEEDETGQQYRQRMTASKRPSMQDSVMEDQ